MSDTDKYKVLNLADVVDMNKFDLFDGRKLKREWSPLKVEFFKSKKKISDSPFLYISFLVINKESIMTLNNYFLDFVELLPLSYQNSVDNYFVVNVINIVDCLDHENSIFSRYDDGRIMLCDKYAFVKEKLIKNHIFKIPEFPRAHIFVSDDFKSAVEDSELTGFIFKEVWNSEKE